MENKGLLFIPDISGFTRFVSETEIEHSRQIIQELLEVLVNANEIGLKISEIEGDAILFYKFGEPPAMDVLYRQVEKMFCMFHRSLFAYDRRKYCQCQSCLAAINLSLKVITHYGEFANYNVKDFRKLIGKDIIVAHQLLKNDIEHHEYWLVTKGLSRDKAPAELAEWMVWNEGQKQTETGEVMYRYAQLSPLKQTLVDEPEPPFDFSGKTKVISLTEEYEADIIPLFHATGDFNFRSRWREGVKKVEEVDHVLPRVGMRCKCTMKDGKEIIYTSSSYSYQPERIEFGETEEYSQHITNYILEQKAPGRTSLTMELFVPDNFFPRTFFQLFHRSAMEASLRKSMQNLVPALKEIRIPAV